MMNNCGYRRDLFKCLNVKIIFAFMHYVFLEITLEVAVTSLDH